MNFIINKNLLKGILSFIWLLPFIYVFFDIYFVIDFRISVTSLKVLIFVSLSASIILFFIWFAEYRKILYLNRAFNYLRAYNIAKLEEILSKTPIDNYIEEGKTLLHYAIDNQMKPDIVAYLISKDGWIQYGLNEDYDISYTLFYLCAYYNYISDKMVSFLIKRGANINFIDNSKGFDGLSILQVLILRGNKSAISILLEKGADINYVVKDLSMDALMLASRYSDDPMIIKMLIDAGANIHEINNDGYNALLLASQYNQNPSIIKVLVNSKARIKPYTVKSALLKYNEVTPLMLAASYNNESVVAQLIQLGDDVNYKDNFDLSVLFMASANNTNVDVLKTLIAAGGSLDEATDSEGNTPLMVASYLNSNINVIKYLVNKTHNLKTKNYDGLDFTYYIQHNNHLSDEEKRILLTRIMSGY